MDNADILEKELQEIKDITNVRWEIPKDAMIKIVQHRKVLSLIIGREATREEAAVDLFLNKKMPKIIILHE